MVEETVIKEIKRLREQTQKEHGEVYDPDKTVLHNLEDEKIEGKKNIINAYDNMIDHHKEMMNGAPDKEKQTRDERIRNINIYKKNVENIELTEENKEIMNENIKQQISVEKVYDKKIAQERINNNTEALKQKVKDNAKYYSKKGWNFAGVVGTMDNVKKMVTLGKTGKDAYNIGKNWWKGTDEATKKLEKEIESRGKIKVKQRKIFEDESGNKNAYKKQLHKYEQLKKNADQDKVGNKEVLKQIEKDIKKTKDNIEVSEKKINLANDMHNDLERRAVGPTGKVTQLKDQIKSETVEPTEKIVKEGKENRNKIYKKHPKLKTGITETIVEGAKKAEEEIVEEVKKKGILSKVWTGVTIFPKTLFEILGKYSVVLFIFIAIIAAIIFAIFAVLIWMVLGVIAMYVAYRRHKNSHPLIRYGFAPIAAYFAAPYYLEYALIAHVVFDY